MSFICWGLGLNPIINAVDFDAIVIIKKGEWPNSVEFNDSLSGIEEKKNLHNS